MQEKGIESNLPKHLPESYYSDARCPEREVQSAMGSIGSTYSSIESFEVLPDDRISHLLEQHAV